MVRYKKYGIKKLYVDELQPLYNGDYIGLGVDGTGIDLKFFGDTASSYALWDYSADKMIFEGADLRLNDSDILEFGDAGDVSMRWDGTDFDILAAADNSIIKFGTGTVSFDIWLYGSTTNNKIVWDCGTNYLTLTGAEIEFATYVDEVFKFADDGSHADLATAVGTLNGAIKVKIGATSAYVATYASYTAT